MEKEPVYLFPFSNGGSVEPRLDQHLPEDRRSIG
jgi:hypothetical protein